MRRRWRAALAWVGIATVMASPVPGPPESTVDVMVTAARLDALTRSLTGSIEELRAAELVSYHRGESAVVACMRAAGRPYRKRPFVSFYDGWTDADVGYGTGRGTVIDSLTERGSRHMLNEMAYARLEHSRTFLPRRSVADWTAIRNCRTQRAGSGIPLGSELAGFPGLSYHRPAVQAAMRGYPKCMRDRYGYQVTDRSDFLFRPRFSRDDAPIPGRPATPAWTRGVAEMRAAFAADADCRRPAYELEMRYVADGLDAWEAGHRAEIDALRAVWRQRVADARVLRQG